MCEIILTSIKLIIVFVLIRIDEALGGGEHIHFVARFEFHGEVVLMDCTGKGTVLVMLKTVIWVQTSSGEEQTFWE